MQGVVLLYVYIIKYHKIMQDTEIFSRIPKRAVILISKHLWKFLERQRKYSSLKYVFRKHD